MQKTVSIITAVLILVCFSAVSARADRKTIEGFMLGTGVAILGAVIIHEINKDSQPRYKPSYSRHNDHYYAGDRYRHGNRHHRKYRHHRPRGHWEIEKRWIEPVYETKWNPGHYNRRGYWIDGRHEKFIVAKGYWQKNKVWVWH